MYRFITGGDRQGLLDQLNGVLRSTVAYPREGLALNGLTLTFTDPAAIVVTFNDPNPVTLEQVVDEINAAAGLSDVASIRVVAQGAGAQRIADRRLILVNPGGGTVALNVGASTAAALLGFTAGVNASKTSVSAANIYGEGVDSSGKHYVIVND